jgi:glyoxylase-like metal-dependent hydrolase (beta-lactamase superfamily II)
MAALAGWHSAARFARGALLAALAAAAGASDWPAAQRIADDIYIFPGAVAAPSSENGGRIANVGVIVGRTGVIVVGTGTSAADGERLLAAIGRLSRRPVVLAIDTYAGPEHVLGNSAFARRGIPILAHRETDNYMAHNCTVCLRRLRDAVGDTAMAGSRLARPHRLIDGATNLVAGGRRLDLLYYGPTQQPGSIAVFDPASGVLFAGGLASFDVLPDAHDADLDAWGEALQQMRRLPLTRVVPARGPPGAPARLAEVAEYLTELARATQHAYATLSDAGESPDLPRYASWAMYVPTHRRNVYFQYLRLEAKEIAGQLTP